MKRMNDCLFFVIRTVIKINVWGGNRFRVYSYVLFFDFNFFLNCNIHIHKTSLSKNLSLHTRPHIVKCQIDVYIYHGISRIFYKKIKINTFELVMMDSHQYLHPSLYFRFEPQQVFGLVCF